MNLNDLISSIGQAEGWGLEWDSSGRPRMAKYNPETRAPFGLLGDTENKPSLKSDPESLYRFMQYKLTDPSSATFVPGLIRQDGSVDETRLPHLRDRWAPLGASNDPKGLNNNWLTNVSNFLSTALNAVIPSAEASENRAPRDLLPNVPNATLNESTRAPRDLLPSIPNAVQNSAPAPSTSERPVTSLLQVESKNSPARLFLTPPEESLSKTERVIDAFTAIPKGIVKGGADIVGILGDIYGLTKMGSDFIRDRLPLLPLPEWYRNIEDKANEILSPADGLFQQIPDSEEIIEGLKDIGVPLDRPKTRLGRYIESFDRGSVGFLTGPLRWNNWTKQMTRLGGTAGVAGEAGEDLSESPLGRTSAEMATLLLTPRLAYSNAGKLLHENMEFLTRRELNDAQRLIEDSHKVGFPLFGPEALSKGPIQGLMADTLASPSGGQLLSTLLKDRPAQAAKIKDKFLAHFGGAPHGSAPTYVRELFESAEPGTEVAIRTLASSAPSAFPSWVANYISQAYEAAVKNTHGGASLHSGWQFADALVGTPQRQKNFEAMMEVLPPAAREEINKTLKVLSASGKIPEIGETAGRTRAKEVATRDEGPPRGEGKARERSIKARERLTELDRRSRKTYIDLATAMGSKRKNIFSPKSKRQADPETLIEMLDLGGFSPLHHHIKQELAKKIGGLLLTGSRADLESELAEE
jgi:hypothetical protein